MGSFEEYLDNSSFENAKNEAEQDIVLEDGGGKKIADGSFKRRLKALALAFILFLAGKTVIDKFDREEYVDLNGYRITEENSVSIYNPENDEYVVLTDFKRDSEECINAMTGEIVNITNYMENGYYSVNLIDMVKSGEVESESIGNNKYKVESGELDKAVRDRYNRYNERVENIGEIGEAASEIGMRYRNSEIDSEEATKELEALGITVDPYYFSNIARVSSEELTPQEQQEVQEQIEAQQEQELIQEEAPITDFDIELERVTGEVGEKIELLPTDYPAYDKVSGNFVVLRFDEKKGPLFDLLSGEVLKGDRTWEDLERINIEYLVRNKEVESEIASVNGKAKATVNLGSLSDYVLNEMQHGKAK